MKKLCLSLLLTALSVPAWSAVVLDDLSFKSVMRGLYAGKLHACVVNDDALTAYPHVCLDEVYDADSPNLDTLALMHPVMSFERQDGQTRHLLMIEKVAIDDEGNHSFGHPNSAKADLYVFKQTATSYELVGKNAKDDDFTGSWGRIHLDLADVQASLQPLGKSLMGGLFESGYCSTGTCESAWFALLIGDDGDVREVFVAQSGSDNSGMYDEDHPLSYSYQSTHQVINDGGRHYPIRLHYTGEKPDDGYESINRINQITTVYFDPKTQTYTPKP